MKALLKFCDIIDGLNKGIAKIFAWILIPMVCITSFEVISRYVFNHPTIWAWELVVQIWGLLLMACGGYCYWKGGFVKVDALYGNFSQKTKNIIELVTNVLVILCMVLILIFGFKMFWASFLRNERESTVWGSPMWTIRFWVPLGAFLMLIEAISKLIRSIFAVLGKIELASEYDEIAEVVESVKETEHLVTDGQPIEAEVKEDQ